MVIEWYEEKPCGEIIGDLKQWRLTRDLPGEWFSSKATKLGRPRGGGGYAANDAPFVDMILERLDESEGVTVHGAVVDLVDQHGDEIPGASHDAKVSRLMKRVRDLRS